MTTPAATALQSLLVQHLAPRAPCVQRTKYSTPSPQHCPLPLLLLAGQAENALRTVLGLHHATRSASNPSAPLDKRAFVQYMGSALAQATPYREGAGAPAAAVAAQ